MLFHIVVHFVAYTIWDHFNGDQHVSNMSFVIHNTFTLYTFLLLSCVFLLPLRCMSRKRNRNEIRKQHIVKCWKHARKKQKKNSINKYRYKVLKWNKYTNIYGMGSYLRLKWNNHKVMQNASECEILTYMPV